MSFVRAIRQLENQISDAQGYYDDYPRFSGVMVEHEGNYAGMFVVRSEHKKMEFIYNEGLVVCGMIPWVGARVTVYYEQDDILCPEDEFVDAVKLVLHDEE